MRTGVMICMWYNMNMKKFIRKIAKAGSHSYVLTIPKELMKKFKWREHQKLEVTASGRGEKFSVKDWKPKSKKKK